MLFSETLSRFERRSSRNRRRRGFEDSRRCYSIASILPSFLRECPRSFSTVLTSLPTSSRPRDDDETPLVRCTLDECNVRRNRASFREQRNHGTVKFLEIWDWRPGTWRRSEIISDKDHFHLALELHVIHFAERYSTSEKDDYSVHSPFSLMVILDKEYSILILKYARHTQILLKKNSLNV